MIAVIQRVTTSEVRVEDEIAGKIGPGLLVLLGVAQTDGDKDVEYLADKIAHLRVFEDKEGKMNRSLLDSNGQMLVISQFTLLGDCRKGRRPSFVRAAPPDRAETLYEAFIDRVRSRGISVASGRFQAKMAVSLVNDGPVTLIVESK